MAVSSCKQSLWLFLEHLIRRVQVMESNSSLRKRIHVSVSSEALCMLKFRQWTTLPFSVLIDLISIQYLHRTPIEDALW